MKSYWDNFARAFSTLRPPLRPSGEDIDFMEQCVAERAAGRGTEGLRVLLLGVTPALASMPLPESASLVAVDNSWPMIQAVWPGNVPQKRRAIRADWREMPCRSRSIDVALGDGSINCMRYPDGFRAFAAAVREALRDDGVLVLRCYMQQDTPETPDKLYDAVCRGDVKGFHAFRLRLFMALQESAESGIGLDDVHRSWTAASGDKHLSAERTGWTQEQIDTMQYCGGSRTVHTFPTLTEFRTVVHEYFEESRVSTAAYEMGEHCPRFILKPR
jgi:hypothetical protein